MRLLIALFIKAINNYSNVEITHIDVYTVFLNGYLKKPIFIKQPDGSISPENRSKVCML